MQVKPLFLIAAFPLSLAACGRGNDEPLTTDPNAVQQDNGDAAAVSSGATSTGQFADVVAASDKFEIEASKLAASSSAAAAVKDFAKMMIDAHTSSTAKLKTIVAKGGPAPNDALNAEQQASLSDLNGKKGADFDAAYIAAQVTGHEKALAALNDYASGGDNADLKQFASELIPTVQKHLEAARKLQKQE